MKRLPKTLYVVLKEKGTENEYLHASADPDVFDNDDMVGIYYQNVRMNSPEWSLTMNFAL